MRGLRVGIDSYSVDCLGMDPFEVLDYVEEAGGDGVQFTAVNLRQKSSSKDLDPGLIREIGDYARERDLYLEWGMAGHIPMDLLTLETRDIAPSMDRAVSAARTLGTSVIRSCSGGLMRWKDSLPPTEVLLKETARALRETMPILEASGCVLAIETHFEFTTYELLRVFEQCDARPGGPLGICLDTMNLLTMLEDPVTATDRVLPYVVATHAKDGCLRGCDVGFESFPVLMGTGQVDWRAILPRLSRQAESINLSVEAHGGTFQMPIFDPFFLSRFPDLSAAELAKLMKLAKEGDRLVEEGIVRVTTREEWPSLCRDRVRQDISSLKRIQSEILLAGEGKEE